MNCSRLYSVVQYCVEKDEIKIHCSGLNQNEKRVADIFNEFILDISKSNNVFMHAYRLFDISKIVDSNAVISQANVLLDPHHSYFYLSEARVKTEYLSDDTCCEIQFFFFDKAVKWEDFLVSLDTKMKKRLFESGLLSAVFYVEDHGADFVFEFNKIYSEKIFNLFDELKGLGWEIKQVKKLR
ncbi:MAG: hypothetical protein UE295_07265 [Acutalibacteraceae bacterium]|nr:hypothetical protein [Acutalibacteraceae bacterium]